MAKEDTQFKEGESGNLRGRPHAYETWKAVIRNCGVRNIDELKAIDLTKIPVKRAIIIKKFIDAYEKGKMEVVNFFANREEGMPKQTIESDAELDINLNFGNINPPKKNDT